MPFMPPFKFMKKVFLMQEEKGPNCALIICQCDAIIDSSSHFRDFIQVSVSLLNEWLR